MSYIMSINLILINKVLSITNTGSMQNRHKINSIKEKLKFKTHKRIKNFGQT